MENNVFTYIEEEGKRQEKNIELIASENFVSEDVKKAVGSCLTNKYAEGYPSKASIEKFCLTHPDYVHYGKTGRYYGGCENVDMVELEAMYWCRKAFHTDYHCNVQPHSGSQANSAAFASVLTPGDTILAMNLEQGGHLTHGSPVNFSGNIYNAVHYTVDDRGFIDYGDIEAKIKEFHPALVVAGASAYSRVIDFARIRGIIDSLSTDEYKPYFMVDMAHIAGLVITGEHPTPFGLADIVTTTCHKTLRGPRGGLIFSRPELAKKVDSAIFPYSQGGPLLHIIAGKAVAAREACTEEYRAYIHQVVLNTRAMADRFIELGYEVVTGGTDNHLFMIDFTRTHPNLSGKAVQDELDKHFITLNKNCVPNEKRSPMQTSGVRIGTAAMTTKGWKEQDAVECADRIDRILRSM
ncbi:MAG: serine hydroxymethyltransferase [Eubacteriales bacterium]|nr:serine hydroxymethyltransferase [Eubacteriales bacterium]